MGPNPENPLSLVQGCILYLSFQDCSAGWSPICARATFRGEGFFIQMQTHLAGNRWEGTAVANLEVSPNVLLILFVLKQSRLVAEHLTCMQHMSYTKFTKNDSA